MMASFLSKSKELAQEEEKQQEEPVETPVEP
jgi:hypothetical protein